MDETIVSFFVITRALRIKIRNAFFLCDTTSKKLHSHFMFISYHNTTK